MHRAILVEGPVENLWGVRTTYGTHPHPPTRLGIRLKRGAKAVVVGAVAVWYFLRR